MPVRRRWLSRFRRLFRFSDDVGLKQFRSFTKAALVARHWLAPRARMIPVPQLVQQVVPSSSPGPHGSSSTVASPPQRPSRPAPALATCSDPARGSVGEKKRAPGGTGRGSG